MSKRFLLALTALSVTGLPLAAQWVQGGEPPRASFGPGGDMMITVVTSSHRAVIGVTIDVRPSDNDSVGASISGVTPGGPAARAGIVAGDIITKFNGTALVERTRRTGGSNDDENAQSGPGLKMLDLASHLSPGDTVTVEWKHERTRKTARIVAEASSAVVLNGDPGMRFFTQDMPGGMRYRVETGDNGTVELQGRLDALRGQLMPGAEGGQFFMRMGGPLGGIQFAPLNADLGRYFGTTDGILVLDTPDTSAHVDLKGGDVILAIGDRKPTSVEHLMRILASYQDDESVHFDLMRDKRRLTIDAKASDLRSSGQVSLKQRLAPSDTIEVRVRPRPPARRRSGT